MEAMASTIAAQCAKSPPAQQELPSRSRNPDGPGLRRVCDNNKPEALRL